MSSLARSFIERVRAGLSGGVDLSRLSQWICRNTRHPKYPDRHWNFKEHEFQIGIVNDSSNDMVVKKCSQVGLSEVSVRSTLGMIDIKPNSTAIYTLPTGGFATTFVKSRFDPVITDSPELRQKMDPETDNTSLKRIGGSFLYIRGTFTQTAAISVPADILIHDEVDFSDPLTLTSFTSRLGHVKEEDVIRRRFSTPTVSGFGVSLLFEQSSQKWYAVKCEHCESWQVPMFERDVVIPGFDGSILKDLEKEDLTDPRYLFDDAYLACPGCKRQLSVGNLANPERRQWVAAKPEATRSGYQVQPFDVPTINPVRRTLKYLDDFDRKADWVNFKLGKDYQDAETSFVKAAVDKAFCLRQVSPMAGAATDTVVGVDVGKTSWISICLPNELTGLDTIYYERVKLQGPETLPSRVKQLFEWYGAQMCIIDAGPEWTQALAVIEALPAGRAFACYYRSVSKPKLSFVELDEENHVALADRTGIISQAAKKVNGGMHRFCKGPDTQTYKAHLDSLKKVTRRDANGKDVEAWVNNGPDHYGHSLFFASVADNLLSYKPKVSVIPALPLPGKAKMKGLEEREPRFQYGP